MRKKKQRTVEELQEHLNHYENLIHGLNPEAIPMIRRQIHKLQQQIKELEIKERIDS